MKFNKPIEGALYLFDLGAKVFPIKPDSKEPAFNDWQAWSENASRKQVENFGTANPVHNWGVYCGPSDLLVVDIDTKKGNGFESLQNLEATNEKLPTTFKVNTPSGGQHIYYKGANRSTVGTIAANIDTRGHGGYVVAPGSRLEDRSYEAANDAPIVSLPEWFVQKLGEKKKVIDPLVQLSEEELIEEGGRNNTMTSLAGKLRAQNYGFKEIYAILSLTNEKRFNPPLPDHELNTIINSIVRYKPESAKAAADFMEVPKANSKHVKDIVPTSIPPRDWIVHDRYLAGDLTVVVAHGGAGKSTITLLDALAIAANKPLKGMDIKRPGAVWVYNTEDSALELDRRVVGLSKKHAIPLNEDTPLYLTSGQDQPLVIAKQDKNHVVVNEKVIDEMVADIKAKNIALLVVDPFVRSHEVNENDNVQIDKVAWAFQQIAKRSKCSVCLVHHTKKPSNGSATNGDANQARGASALVNAARIVYTVTVMTKDEAKNHGIDKKDRYWYAAFQNAKANFSAPGENKTWYKKSGEDIMNGDVVGVVEVTDLINVGEVKMKESEEAYTQDVLHALTDIMSNGDAMSYTDVSRELNKKHSHLFKEVDSERSCIRRLKSLITFEGLSEGGKFFKLIKNPDSFSKSKNLISCGNKPTTSIEDFLE